jgi:hypothetical protein
MPASRIACLEVALSPSYVDTSMPSLIHTPV